MLCADSTPRWPGISFRLQEVDIPHQAQLCSCEKLWKTPIVGIVFFANARLLQIAGALAPSGADGGESKLELSISGFLMAGEGSQLTTRQEKLLVRMCTCQFL